MFTLNPFAPAFIPSEDLPVQPAFSEAEEMMFDMCSNYFNDGGEVFRDDEMTMSSRMFEMSNGQFYDDDKYVELDEMEVRSQMSSVLDSDSERDDYLEDRESQAVHHGEMGEYLIDHETFGLGLGMSFDEFSVAPTEDQFDDDDDFAVQGDYNVPVIGNTNLDSDSDDSSEGSEPEEESDSDSDNDVTEHVVLDDSHFEFWQYYLGVRPARPLRQSEARAEDMCVKGYQKKVRVINYRLTICLRSRRAQPSIIERCVTDFDSSLISALKDAGFINPKMYRVQVERGGWIWIPEHIAQDMIDDEDITYYWNRSSDEVLQYFLYNHLPLGMFVGDYISLLNIKGLWRYDEFRVMKMMLSPHTIYAQDGYRIDDMEFDPNSDEFQYMNYQVKFSSLCSLVITTINTEVSCINFHLIDDDRDYVRVVVVWSGLVDLDLAFRERYFAVGFPPLLPNVRDAKFCIEENSLITVNTRNQIVRRIDSRYDTNRIRYYPLTTSPCTSIIESGLRAFLSNKGLGDVSDLIYQFCGLNVIMAVQSRWGVHQAMGLFCSKRGRTRVELTCLPYEKRVGTIAHHVSARRIVNQAIEQGRIGEPILSRVRVYGNEFICGEDQISKRAKWYSPDVNPNPILCTRVIQDILGVSFDE